VLVDGRSILTEPEHARRRIGFMPDTLGTYSYTTIAEYLDFFARAVGLTAEQRRQRIEAVVAFTDLGGLMDRMMDKLSKGMGQRLCLAKTLLHDPDVLILDEPANGLDPRARVEFRELIRALADQGKAVLISSHILSELSETCDGAVVIERGRVVRAGALRDLAVDLRRHEVLFVRTLGDVSLLERTLAESPGVLSSRPEGGGVLVDFAGGPELQAALLEDLVRRGLKPVEFHGRQLNLEDMFMSFTQGEVQ
jgi:ABC-2 type transport system ATP-binding protein